MRIIHISINIQRMVSDPKRNAAPDAESPPLSSQGQSGDQDNAIQSFSRMLKSEDLLKGASEVGIQHGDAIYRLMRTKSGKLILKK